MPMNHSQLGPPDADNVLALGLVLALFFEFFPSHVHFLHRLYHPLRLRPFLSSGDSWEHVEVVGMTPMMVSAIRKRRKLVKMHYLFDMDVRKRSRHRSHIPCNGVV